VPELALGELALRHFAEAELHRDVAAALRVPNRRDGTGPRIDHGHRHARSVLAEYLRHAEPLADDGGHISPQTAVSRQQSRGPPSDVSCPLSSEISISMS